jgi:hypothetical protein
MVLDVRPRSRTVTNANACLLIRSRKRPVDQPGILPVPSDAVVVHLANLAVHVEKLLAADHPLDKTPVGLTNAKNDRRRAMETILVLLADAEVRDYLAELKRLGLVTVKG